MTLRTPTALILALVSAGFSAPGMAQTDHSMHASPTAKLAANADPAAMGEGSIKKIDKTKGTVTLAHGALPNGMPPMTMAYRVKDSAWLDKMQVGQKIRFATDPADGGMTVLRFELVK